MSIFRVCIWTILTYCNNEHECKTTSSYCMLLKIVNSVYHGKDSLNQTSNFRFSLESFPEVQRFTPLRVADWARIFPHKAFYLWERSFHIQPKCNTCIQRTNKAIVEGFLAYEQAEWNNVMQLYFGLSHCVSRTTQQRPLWVSEEVFAQKKKILLQK